MGRLSQIAALSRAIGAPGTISVLARRMLRMRAPLRPRTPVGRVLLRPCESDLFVAAQTLGDFDYKLPDDVIESLQRLATQWRAEGVAPLIIDAGANVGYSSLFFANAYPDAEIVALEPDSATFDVLRRNVSSAPRIHARQAALWAHDDGVDLVRDDEAGSWASSVREGGGLTPSCTLASLLGGFGDARILILKLDIEGAERQAVEAALAHVQAAACIIVEPHDFMLPGHGSLSPLFRALADQERDTLVSGENLIFVQSALRRAIAVA